MDIMCRTSRLMAVRSFEPNDSTFVIGFLGETISKPFFDDLDEVIGCGSTEQVLKVLRNYVDHLPANDLRRCAEILAAT